MSLQGTLDTFGLHDVLGILSTTKKKGELKIAGPGLAGSVWMDEGKLVGAQVPRCPTLVDAIFELLRLEEGEFSFQAESPNRGPMPPQAVGDVLSDAEDRMIEWRDIAVHIPSVHTQLRLAPAAPSSQVVLDPDQWRLVVASAMGASLAELADALQMGEFQICRTAKYLVENGLASAEAVAPAQAQAPAKAQPAAPATEVPVPEAGGQPAAPPAPAGPEPAAAAAAATKPAPLAQEPAPAAATPPPAAPATPPAAQPPPPPVVEDEEEKPKPGEPVDRSALLKFLSSVRN